MEGIFIGVGSNIRPEENVRRALGLLGKGLTILQVSTFYRSEALERPGQPFFYNGVLSVATELEPRALKYDLLRSVEADLQRKRSEDRYAPRTIDLDILLFGDRIIKEPGLEIPDPDIERRPFIALPLLELAPGLMLPGSGKPLAGVAAAFGGRRIEPLYEYTLALRKSLNL